MQLYLFLVEMTEIQMKLTLARRRGIDEPKPLLVIAKPFARMKMIARNEEVNSGCLVGRCVSRRAKNALDKYQFFNPLKTRNPKTGTLANR